MIRSFFNLRSKEGSGALPEPRAVPHQSVQSEEGSVVEGFADLAVNGSSPRLNALPEANQSTVVAADHVSVGTAASAKVTGAPAVDMSAFGCVEVCSARFVIGWAAIATSGSHACVYASLDGETIGIAAANQTRPDLQTERSKGRVNARAFLISFDKPVPQERMEDVKVFVTGQSAPLPLFEQVRFDPFPERQVFILGSPRSGTSQLGLTLVEALELPWTGEAHAAPGFSAAAATLSDSIDPRGDFGRQLGQNGCTDDILALMRRTYFQVHSSASFLDKTPGLPMIEAAPFAERCFPDARFIFLHRHPIGNIQSRLARLGGDFSEHCEDWAMTMRAWQTISPRLSATLSLSQSDMRGQPAEVAARLAKFLNVQDRQDRIAASLANGSAEYTGAGSPGQGIEATGWTDAQKETYLRVCAPVAAEFGYGS